MTRQRYCKRHGTVTHFRGASGHPACGAPQSWGTEDPSNVECRACHRTRVYRAVRAQQFNECCESNGKKPKDPET